MRRRPPGVIASPNIWNWPGLYEIENRAQDPDAFVYAAVRRGADWAHRDVLDIGCGSGFHLPVFAFDAASVIGLEPHEGLRRSAAARTAHLGHVRVIGGSAERTGLAPASVDVVHARTAYFFGPGCGPGIAEAMRVLRPGGVLVIVDLDATVHDYGRWMREDLPHYNPDRVETFFAAQGFDIERVDTRWVFRERRDLDAVLGIEFSARVAARASATIAGLSLQVGYRIHTRRADR